VEYGLLNCTQMTPSAHDAHFVREVLSSVYRAVYWVWAYWQLYVLAATTVKNDATTWCRVCVLRACVCAWQAIFTGMGSNLGIVTQSFLQSLGASVFSCKNLNSVANSMHNLMCCDFLCVATAPVCTHTPPPPFSFAERVTASRGAVCAPARVVGLLPVCVCVCVCARVRVASGRNAFYWFVSAWILIAFSMLFCGCCAGTMARKRLVAAPWVRSAPPAPCTTAMACWAPRCPCTPSHSHTRTHSTALVQRLSRMCRRCPSTPPPYPHLQGLIRLWLPLSPTPSSCLRV
jgi:hypothetical protein